MLTDCQVLNAVPLASTNMTSHPRKGSPEEQECPYTWQ